LDTENQPLNSETSCHDYVFIAFLSFSTQMSRWYLKIYRTGSAQTFPASPSKSLWITPSSWPSYHSWETLNCWLKQTKRVWFQVNI